MAMDLRLQHKMTQQLVMTPQLQQAIKLLALSHNEMAQLIRDELMENPVLEEIEGDLTGSDAREPNPTTSQAREGSAIESMVASVESLTDHLRWQVLMADLTAAQRLVALFLVEEINDDGYLNPDALSMATISCDVTLQCAAEVLALVQQFDPPGVGCRDLRECLTLQARETQQQNSTVLRIIDDCLPLLQRHAIKDIAKKLKISVDEVVIAVKAIRHFDPKPGRSFITAPTQYITPDLYVYKVGSDAQNWAIAVNEEGMPQIGVGPLYGGKHGHHYDASTQAYLQDKLRHAQWLIRSMQMRNRTMYRVMQSILSFQLDFFEQGIEHLRPLILREVAEDVGMHESTISRVTTRKYVHTPQGIYPLKFFFNSAIAQLGGEALASQSVRSHIQRLISEEQRDAPLSDQRIVELLRQHDIDIARRTVAKYREMLGFEPSSRRKRMY